MDVIAFWLLHFLSYSIGKANSSFDIDKELPVEWINERNRLKHWAYLGLILLLLLTLLDLCFKIRLVGTYGDWVVAIAIIFICDLYFRGYYKKRTLKASFKEDIVADGYIMLRKAYLISVLIRLLLIFPMWMGMISIPGYTEWSTFAITFPKEDIHRQNDRAVLGLYLNSYSGKLRVYKNLILFKRELFELDCDAYDVSKSAIDNLGEDSVKVDMSGIVICKNRNGYNFYSATVDPTEKPEFILHYGK